MFRCLTPWTHRYGWPQADADGRLIERCTLCGRTRVAKLALPVNPRFDIPRHQPKPAREQPAVIAITRRRGKKTSGSGRVE